MSFSHFSPYDSSHHRKFCLWCQSQRAQRGKRDAECWLHRQTGGLIHLSPFGENRGNEEQNSSPGEKFKVEKSTGSQRKGEKCFSAHSFFSHCRTQGQPHFPQLCSGDTAELHLQRLLQFSVLDISGALILDSLVPAHDASSAAEEGKGKNGEWLSYTFEGRRKEQLWPIPMALCWLRQTHPIKCVGHGVQFINFGGGGRLTGLVLTWIMMDHQERAQENLQLNQTQRVSSSINVGQVLSIQSDSISI